MPALGLAKRCCRWFAEATTCLDVSSACGAIVSSTCTRCMETQSVVAALQTDIVCESLVDSYECLCVYLTFPRVLHVGMGLVGLILSAPGLSRLLWYRG